jgi:hypothetical protein
MIGTGDQGWSAGQMLRTVLQAAVNWMERGLPLRLLKIVIYQEDVARDMTQVFMSCKNAHRNVGAQPQIAVDPSASPPYDLFLSYSPKEAEFADYFVNRLRESSNSAWMIFHDKTSLREGSTWLMRVADALDTSRRVVAFYSPAYWTSKNCQMEFLAAFSRQVDTGQEILFPYTFQMPRYHTCFEACSIQIAA